jgi:hypothetical protein
MEKPHLRRWMEDHMHRILSLILVCSLLAASAGCSLVNPNLIRVHAHEDYYGVSNLGSEFYVFIPRKGYVREKPKTASDHSSYFYFSDERRGMILSGWIVPGDDYPGKLAYWDETVLQWKEQGLTDPQNVEHGKQGNWDGTLYEGAIPSGLVSPSGETSSHMWAHWVQYGTWIHLHLSVTSKLPSREHRDLLVQELKGIRVQKRH